MNIDLEKGRTYFKLTYSDADFTMPGVEPLVYIGKNSFIRCVGDDSDTYQFQDTISYQKYGYVTDLNGKHKHECSVEVFRENELGSSIMTLDEIYSFIEQSITKAKKLNHPVLTISQGKWVTVRSETWVEIDKNE